jgi:hypothetical protein
MEVGFQRHMAQTPQSQALMAFGSSDHGLCGVVMERTFPRSPGEAQVTPGPMG